MDRVKGLPVSRGVAIGKAFWLQAEAVAERAIQPQEVETEVRRFDESVAKASAQLQELERTVRETVGEEQAAILGAHLAFLQDPSFVGEMRRQIAEQLVDAATAVQRVVDQWVPVFEAMDDAYMRERAADIRDVGKRIRANLSDEQADAMSRITEPVVLLADDLTPSETIQLPRQFVRGVAVAKGGATSHAAILARSLGIPAVMGVGDQLARDVRAGDLLIVDGATGEIRVNPDAETIAVYQTRADEERRERKQLELLRDLPAVTRDGRTVKLKANIGRPEELEQVLAKGVDGIGLYRSEFLFMDRASLPTEEEQFEAYRAVAEGMAGKPVIIRTLDIGGDKHLPYLNLPNEMNPFLGYRALRISLDEPEMFKVQLRAILRASAFGNVLIMFPMVSHVEQVREAKRLLAEAKRELSEKGISYDPEIAVGVMIEVPAACLIADALAREVQFFSIGTNDLVQYALAVDRMNEKLTGLYSYFHPAVLHLIKLVIDASHRHNIWTGMCGEMAGDPLAAELLLGLGLDEFSAAGSQVLQVKQRIRNASYEQAKQLAERVLTLETPDQVEQYLKEQYKA